MRKIVTIGGGGGHSQVLRALKRIKDIEITGICPSTDSGGSTGLLQRDYEGSGYLGDVTKCIVALCDDEMLARALMYRYENGPLHSHSVKNLLFHSLEKVSAPLEALAIMGRVCGLGVHRIVPVTHEKTELCARLRIGNVVSGETNIDTLAKNPLWNPSVHSISEMYLKPKVRASKIALDAIVKADYLIVSPGDLYSSVVPVLLPTGVKEAIKRSQAKIVVILNIMTKKGETDNYTALDFVDEIEKHLGRKADFILCNNAPIPRKILLKYSLENKVELDSLSKIRDPRLIAVPLAEVTKSDQIVSSPAAIRITIERLIKSSSVR